MPLNPFEKEHVRDILLRNQQISRLIDSAMNDIARRFATVKGKRFASIMTERLADLQDQILNNGKDGIKNQWLLANKKNNKEIDGYLQSNLVTEDMYKSFRSPNLSALNAFLDRTRNGKTLNGRVWNITRTAGKEINDLIGQGVLEGKSAIQTARDLKKYAKGKPILYKGKLIKGSNINFQAIRLAATEMNLAFRTADYLQNSRLPFVTGVTVHLSPAHPRPDICDEMEGGYPKGFHFGGWHPLCYSDDTEVYTNEGWKLFEDLSGYEEILSLNPDTKELEYTEIIKRMSYTHNGDMIRYYNRSLDMMVTPDHKMICFNKHDKILKEMSANEYYESMSLVKKRNVYSSTYNLYRSSEHSGIDITYIEIDGYKISAYLYCEFMGYYLSEGNTSRKYAVTVSQNRTRSSDNYKKICDCLKKMPFKFKENELGMHFYNKSIWEHVKPFGKSHEKYVPSIIKVMTPELIEVFLAAYTLGDGTVRKTKNWKSGKFKDERVIGTSSIRMAGDIGELILRIGHHPSFNLITPKGKISKHWNGEYASNYDQWIIRDCRSQYAVQFKKEKIKYNGIVYDIEIEKNHIIYTRRNGKCVWGSNCICYATYDRISPKKFVDYIKTGNIGKRRFTRAIPQRAQRYIKKNGKRFQGYKSVPYWLEDNFTQDLKLRSFVKTPLMDKPISMSKPNPVMGN